METSAQQFPALDPRSQVEAVKASPSLWLALLERCQVTTKVIILPASRHRSFQVLAWGL